jgi:hypothetical protein
MNYTSRSQGNQRTMRVTILDPLSNTTRTASITNIQVCKAGLLARTVSENFNVFRAWESDQWMENMTSSSRFNFEIEGMKPEEIEIFLNEQKFQKAFKAGR